MITPSPTSRIDPKHARGVYLGPRQGGGGPPLMALAVPNTSYELHLVPAGKIETPAGKRILGVIRMDARRVDAVGTGGRYIEPVHGRPRQVQGTVIASDPAANILVVDAGVPVHAKLTDPRQKAAQFEPGTMVAFAATEGATFTPQPT